MQFFCQFRRVFRDEPAKWERPAARGERERRKPEYGEGVDRRPRRACPLCGKQLRMTARRKFGNFFWQVPRHG